MRSESDDSPGAHSTRHSSPFAVEMRNVSKVFPTPEGGQVTAVDGIDLQVAVGTTLCLIGTSGSGKTTALKMINRLIEATSGTINVDGTAIEALDVIKLRRSIGYVIQRGGLFPHMTVARNIGLLCHLEGWPRRRIKSRVDEVLDLVNLPPTDFSERHPRELSN